nr:MAG: hypothetical protein [Owegonang virus 2]
MEATIQEPTINPTEIVSLDETPTYMMDLTEEDLKKFTYTGITIRVKVPFIKNNDNAIFAINTDGFIPGVTYRSDSIKSLMINLFPVQVFETSMDLVEIFYEPVALPILHYYMSYRYVKGKPRIGLRLSSNVGQTGNFQVVQASGLQRLYYTNTEPYKGLRFVNTENTSSTFAPAGITLWDVSINRNLGITPVTRENMPALDLMMKKYGIVRPTSSAGNVNFSRNVFTSQFLEEWLFFTPQNSFPNTNGGDIEIGVYMDWSELQFDMPGVPIQPITVNLKHCDILKVSESFNGKRADDINISTPAGWQTALKWLPGPPPTFEEEVEEEVAKN